MNNWEEFNISTEEVRNELLEKIKDEGEILEENFLRVDSFLNHQIDTNLIDRVGEVIAENHTDKNITKVVTAEAGGNIIAYATSVHLNRLSTRQIPVVYAKKGIPKTMKNPITQKIESATKGGETELALSKNYLDEEDNVLIVDDFLYTGLTSEALTKLVKSSGASVQGYAFIIAKRNFGGIKRLEKFDIPFFVLVEIEKLDVETGKIHFSKDLKES